MGGSNMNRCGSGVTDSGRPWRIASTSAPGLRSRIADRLWHRSRSGHAMPMLVVLLLAVPAPAAAATYYVDPAPANCSARNANPGTTQSAPWCTPPGTRNVTNSGFQSTSWGSVTTSNKIKCGDVILLKGGSTQTSAQGGAWRIDNGPNADNTGYYTLTCSAANPITIRVANGTEWPGSSGSFTLNGSGVTPTCNTHCGAGGVGALIVVTSVNGFVLGGNSAGQYLVVTNAAGGSGRADGVWLEASNGGACPACGGGAQLDAITLGWVEVSNSANEGIDSQRLKNSRYHHINTHNNGGVGVQTGGWFDHHQTAVGIEDANSYDNGLDGFNFLGCQSCFLVRGSSHGSTGARGLNYGELTGMGWEQDMHLLIRDVAFYDNGPANIQVFASGACWSGDDVHGSAGTGVQYGFLERSVIYHNRRGGSACAYGTGWAEVWNTVFFNNAWDGTMSPTADIPAAVDLDYLAVYNSIVQKRASPNKPWSSGAPRGPAAPIACPKSDYNLYVPQSTNSETFSDFNCTGAGSYSATARTFASPPAFVGANDKIGATFTVGFVATHDTIFANNDFRLTASSSAIDGGTYMMRANGAGSGSTINVLGNGGSNDPRNYFIGPSSYLDATPDTIQIQGCGPVTITSLSATSISFTPSCSWASGAGVHLPWSGTAPDMGAFEYGLSSPTSLSAPTLLSVDPLP